MNRSLRAEPVLLVLVLASLASGPALAQAPAPVAPAPVAPAPAAPATVEPPAEPPAGAMESSATLPEPAEVHLEEEPAAPLPRSAPGFQAPPPPGVAAAAAPDHGPLVDEDVAEPELPRPSLAESRFQLQGVLETQWNTDPSFDLFSRDDGAGMGGLSAGYAVLSSPQWAVVPELGWGRLDASRNALFGGGIEETTLVTDRFHAGVSLRYALASVFEPHVRVSGGLDVVNASVEAQSTPRLTQEELAPFGAIGAGATLHTTPGGLSRRGLTRTLLLGITVEGGYTLSPSIEISPKPEGGAPRVSTRDASLGSLSRSGPYLRFAATIRL